MKTPELSVVMSVYNGQKHLEKTINSVLSQKNVDLEFIIVNDGSTDKSEIIIRSIMKEDSRVSLINQTNIGLTRALIVGCDVAKGEYIARQDVGDTSVPGRLRAQLDLLIQDKDIALISSGVVFLTTEGDELYSIIQSEEEALTGLKKTNIKTIQGPPHHGCVTFRKSIYKRVGGYRKEFIYAQDLDLWTRMVEYGDHISLNKIYYSATWERNSISSLKRKQQHKMAQKIIECCKARAKLGDDSLVLDTIDADYVNFQKTERSNRWSKARYYYFLGSNLTKNNPESSAKYFIYSLRLNPFYWKSIVKLIFLKWNETS